MSVESQMPSKESKSDGDEEMLLLDAANKCPVKPAGRRVRKPPSKLLQQSSYTTTASSPCLTTEQSHLFVSRLKSILQELQVILSETGPLKKDDIDHKMSPEL